MATGAYDVSSRGFKQHTVTANAQGVDTTTVGQGTLLEATSSDDVISAAAVHVNVILIVMIIACITANYVRPQIYCFREFWKNCFRKKCWWGPPRAWALDLVWFIMDGFFAFSMIHFLYVYRNPPAGQMTNFYASIFSLMIVYLALRWWWIICFWNFHHRPIALGLAIFFIFAALATMTAIIILLGIIGDFWAMGFAIPVWIWLIFCLVWTVIVYRCFSCGKCQPYYGPCATPVCNTGSPKK